VLVLLVVLIASSVAEKTSVVEGRTLSLKPLQGKRINDSEFVSLFVPVCGMVANCVCVCGEIAGFSKNLAELGVVCKCCDGGGGDCRSTWTESCSNLQCSPWKSHLIIS